MKAIFRILAIAVFLLPAVVSAQSSDQAELTRDVIKAEKKLIVNNNMDLTEEEAKKFWPVYEKYQADLQKINERTATLIVDYAERYNTMSDGAAKTLLDEAVAIDDSMIKLKQGYLPEFYKVLPAKKVARYYQLENKLRAIIDYELARQIPLVR